MTLTITTDSVTLSVIMVSAVYAECHVFIVMLSAVILNVIALKSAAMNERTTL